MTLVKGADDISLHLHYALVPVSISALGPAMSMLMHWLIFGKRMRSSCRGCLIDVRAHIVIGPSMAGDVYSCRWSTDRMHIAQVHSAAGSIAKVNCNFKFYLIERHPGAHALIHMVPQTASTVSCPVYRPRTSFLAYHVSIPHSKLLLLSHSSYMSKSSRSTTDQFL